MVSIACRIRTLQKKKLFKCIYTSSLKQYGQCKDTFLSYLSCGLQTAYDTLLFEVCLLYYFSHATTHTQAHSLFPASFQPADCIFFFCLRPFVMMSTDVTILCSEMCFFALHPWLSYNPFLFIPARTSKILCALRFCIHRYVSTLTFLCSAVCVCPGNSINNNRNHYN